MHFYQRLRDLREDFDLSQEQIAQLLHSTQEQYSRWETGNFRLPIEHYKTLAQFYNVSIDYLCGLVNVPRSLDGSPYSAKKANQVNNIHIGDISGGNNKFEIH